MCDRTMANCTHEFCLQYPHLFQEEKLKLVREIEIEKWFLMGSPVGVVALTSAYLVFVLFVGPKYMSTRKPYNVKGLIRLYNIFQVIYNTHTFLQIFVVEGALYYLYHHSCFPMPVEQNPLGINFFNTCWLYMVSKMIDLLDTVFFVIRKKQDHVTFLHVYHHSVMMLSTWYFLQHIRGGQMALLGLVNSFVHSCMYTYYFVSSFTAMQPYLWWKHYITIIQILQFVICGIYMFDLIVRDCNIPYKFTLYATVNDFFFLYLFGKFYYTSYIKVKKE